MDASTITSLFASNKIGIWDNIRPLAIGTPLKCKGAEDV